MNRLTSEPFRRKSDDSLENYKVRRYGREEWEKSVQKVINKLGKLEDIEEELGCPLEVVFRALNEGIHIQTEFLNIAIKYFILKPRLYFSNDFKCYCLETGYGANMFKLKDYQKTWWLKGEKDETCNGTD